MLIGVSNSIPSSLVAGPQIEMLVDMSPKILVVCVYIPPICLDSYKKMFSIISTHSITTYSDKGTLKIT